MEQDGSEFFMRQGIATALYEQLFAAPSIDGDIAHYRAFCDRCGPRVLDAACGTGRVALALARPDRRIVAFDAS
ncbi:MAG TPA: class I SAM-dependent methyltransferase, partial [Thalassobaculum sp.]